LTRLVEVVTLDTGFRVIIGAGSCVIVGPPYIERISGIVTALVNVEEVLLGMVEVV
jgi:hypothetical protein